MGVSNGQCVASCQSGFTSINGVCQPCNPNCAECSGSIDTCTQCISGFRIDATTQRCVSSTQCEYGQAVNNNGVCERICDQGFLFYEGLCVFGGCFNGYNDNGFGGCTRNTKTETTTVACFNGQFLLNGVCVNNCGASHYPDSLSGRCQPCSTNCHACFSAKFCIKCTNGYESLNGECQALTTCPSNQFQYGDKCCSVCPVGTSSNDARC